MESNCILINYSYSWPVLECLIKIQYFFSFLDQHYLVYPMSLGYLYSCSWSGNVRYGFHLEEWALNYINYWLITPTKFVQTLP